MSGASLSASLEGHKNSFCLQELEFEEDTEPGTELT